MIARGRPIGDLPNALWNEARLHALGHVHGYSCCSVAVWRVLDTLLCIERVNNELGQTEWNLPVVWQRCAPQAGSHGASPDAGPSCISRKAGSRAPFRCPYDGRAV